MKRLLLVIISVVLLTCLYSYKLLTVPANLTVDEAVFGYNSALLAETGRDENGRFMPFFVLTAGTNDWHQPLTQYFIVLLFKLFGPSVYLLRFSSVIIAVVSVVFFYHLAKTLLSQKAALAAALVLALSPLMMFQAHMGQENIMPVPLIIGWLYFLFSYKKNTKISHLVVSALFLGASLYSYKGMRAITSIWVILSLVWLAKDSISKKVLSKDSLIFLFSILPFYLIIPLLERLYAGAVLGGSSPGFNNLYDFFLPYLSAFDLSYIFVRGDINDLHSTGRHGMLLLATAPLIFIGIYYSLKQKSDNFKFVLLALVTGPILFGLVGSVHRFSRLLSLLPLYSLLAGLGWQQITSPKHRAAKFVGVFAFILIALNFFDFSRFYWTTYPSLTRDIIGDLSCYQDMAALAKASKSNGKDAYLHRQVSEGGSVGIKFYQLVYFGRLLPVVQDNGLSPENSVLLTQRAQVDGMEKYPINTVCHYVLER